MGDIFHKNADFAKKKEVNRKNIFLFLEKKIYWFANRPNWAFTLTRERKYEQENFSGICSPRSCFYVFRNGNVDRCEF